MSYRFESNASYFKIEFEVADAIQGYFPQTGLSTREGISVLYRPKSENNWFNIDCYAWVNSVAINMTHFVEENEMYEILIYGPIGANLTKLQIIMNDDDYGTIIDWIPEKSMIAVGGANTFGIGCTTASFLFSNILERKFNVTMYNASFNNRNYLENVYTYYQSSNPPIVDIGILELDHYSQSESAVEELLPEIISLMNLRCKKLIGWYNIPENKAFKKIIANNTIKNFIYENKLEIVDLSKLYDVEYRDMCTFNNYYINDTGNMMLYKELSKVIRRLK